MNIIVFMALNQQHCSQLFLLFLPDEGQVITVYAADYGRHDQTTCSYDRPPAQIQKTDCSSPTSKVAERYSCPFSCSFSTCSISGWRLWKSKCCFSLYNFHLLSDFMCSNARSSLFVTLPPQLQWEKHLYYQSKQLSVWRPLCRHLQVPGAGLHMWM